MTRARVLRDADRSLAIFDGDETGRAEGETLHKEKKHKESQETLAKAEKILGI